MMNRTRDCRQHTDTRKQADSCTVTGSDAGFTMIEVMVAMTVLLIGMLGVMGMQYYSISGSAASRDVRTATSLASEALEMLKSEPYGSIATGVESVASEAASTGGVQYTRATWVISDCIEMKFSADNNLCAGLAPVCSVDPDTSQAVPVSAVRVRTCWTDKDGIDRAITIDSIRWDENEIL